MKNIRALACVIIVLNFNIQANDGKGDDSVPENEITKAEKKSVANSEQLFEYYGMRDKETSDKSYSTYFFVNGVRKLGATTDQTAEIENIQGNKCIAEKQITKMGNDPAAAMTVGYVLCDDDDKLVRMSSRSKEIELVVPAGNRKIELKVYGQSRSEDTYFLVFEKLKDYTVNGTKYHQVICRGKKLFSDKQGKVLFAITKSYFVKDVGLIYEVSYLAKNLKTPTMEKVLNQ